MVNLESMTSKPNAGGGNKDCVSWKIEEAVDYFVHVDHHGFFYGRGKRAAAAGGLPHMGRGAVTLQTPLQVPGNPGREWRRMLILHIQDASE